MIGVEQLVIFSRIFNNIIFMENLRKEEKRQYSQEEMQKEIVAYLADKLGLVSETIKPECTLRGDLYLDSLDQVELFMLCEVHFQVSIPDDEAVNIVTLGDLYKCLSDKCCTSVQSD